MAEDMNLYVDVKVHTWEELLAAIYNNRTSHYNTTVGNYIIDIVEDIDCQGMVVTPDQYYKYDDCSGDANAYYSVIKLRSGTWLISSNHSKIKNLVVESNPDNEWQCFIYAYSLYGNSSIIGVTFENLQIKTPVKLVTGRSGTQPGAPTLIDCCFDVKYITDDDASVTYPMSGVTAYRCRFNFDFSNANVYSLGQFFYYGVNWVKACILYLKGFDSTRNNPEKTGRTLPAIISTNTSGGLKSPCNSGDVWYSNRNVVIFDKPKLFAGGNVTASFLYMSDQVLFKNNYIAIINPIIEGEGTINDSSSSPGWRLFVTDDKKSIFTAITIKGVDNSEKYIFPLSELKNVDKLIELGLFDTEWKNKWEYDKDLFDIPVPKQKYSTNSRTIKDVYIGGTNVYEIYIGDTLVWAKKDILKDIGYERLFYIRHWRLQHEKLFLDNSLYYKSTPGSSIDVCIEFTVDPLSADDNNGHKAITYSPLALGHITYNQTSFPYPTDNNYMYAWVKYNYGDNELNINLSRSGHKSNIYAQPGLVRRNNTTERYKICLHSPLGAHANASATIHSDEFNGRRVVSPYNSNDGSMGNMQAKFGLGSDTDYSDYENTALSCFYYRYKVYFYEFLVRDLIPACRLSDKAVGWYDMASKTFFSWNDADGTGQQSGLDFAGPYPGSDLYKEIQEKNKQ